MTEASAGLDRRRLSAGVISLGILWLLDRMASGQLHPLQRATASAAELMHHYHSVSKATLIVLVLALVLSFRGRESLATPLLGRVTWSLALGTQIVIAAAMIWAYTMLPSITPLGGFADYPMHRYGLAISLFILWQVLTFLLLAPACIRQFDARRAIALLGISIAAITVFVFPNPFIIITEEFTKNLAVNLAMQIYPWFGAATPQIEYLASPVISAREFSIRIDAYCAGYDGMFAVSSLLLTLIAVQWPSLRIPRALLLLIAGVIGVFLLNALRIALLFHIGVEYSPQIAVEGFHSHFGTLAMMSVVIVGMFCLQSRHLRRPGYERPGLPPLLAQALPIAQNALTLIAPLALLLALGMVLGLFNPGFNWLYPVTAIAGLGLMWLYRARLRQILQDSIGALSIGAGLIVFVIWLLMIPLNTAASAEFNSALTGMPLVVMVGWIVMRAIGASIVVPIFEELAFRGGMLALIREMLAGLLGRTVATAAAVTATSLAFGALHSTFWPAVLAGFVYAGVALSRHGLGGAIVAHALTNALISAYAVGFGAWSYW